MHGRRLSQSPSAANRPTLLFIQGSSVDEIPPNVEHTGADEIDGVIISKDPRIRILDFAVALDVNN